MVLIISFLCSYLGIFAQRVDSISLQQGHTSESYSSDDPLEVQSQDQSSGASVCPKYICLDEYVDNCLTTSGDTHKLGDCKDNFYCPSFSLSSPPESVECVQAEHSYEPPSIDCVIYAYENDVCNQTIPCHPDYFCKEGALICTRRASSGDICEYLDDCEIGNICNKGICVEYFTVDSGNSADSKLACSSAKLSNGICSESSATTGSDLPKLCESDDDCIASDGAKGECICVPNSRREKYCRLHDSDEPVKNYLAAANDGRIESSSFLLYYELNYPIIERAEPCYFKDTQELIKFKQLKKWANKCSASYLALIGLLIIIF
ncbi:unnamed protein product [Blepharisma stoltei]|uniref:Uncharacterized protein n=1 Tax=Blepharisma stoltei TaxID=1481888 RepID=A0AAU9J721_9CILI|nr:unnamed protein product [Blepharisma stoltei]